MTREDSSYWKYGYDSLGQVTNGSRFLANDTPAIGLAYGYNYDDIGNRSSTQTNGQTSTYTTNALNQYTVRTVPPVVEVRGVAAADATVTVNGQPTQRQGEAYFGSVSYAGQVRPLWSEIDVAAARAGNAAAQVRHAWLTADEAFSYDADGNLTADGEWSYSWDGENRLVSMQTRSDIVAPNGVFPPAGARRLDFTYDAWGRRIAKKVSSWTPGGWHVISELRFVYDEWNLVAELAMTSATSVMTPVRTYVWGLDLSNTPQGAGGVGGLICLTDFGLQTTAFVAYDGNGNIGGLIDAADGSVAVRYDYNAFGQTVTTDGRSLALASRNPFGFSTKYTDVETGYAYFGFRYYAPGVGRWLSRDPAEEGGGANLYGFVANRSCNAYDALGQRLEPYTKDTNQLYLARATHTPTTAGEGGEAGIHWSFEAVVDGSRLTISGSLDLQPVVFPIADIGGPYLTARDRFGLTVTEHERYHDRVAAKWWNSMVPLANALEGDYACEPCATVAKQIVDALNEYMRDSQYAENTERDLGAYARGTVTESAYQAEQTELSRKAQNALRIEKDRWRLFRDLGCKPK